ncbi:MAG: efflux RND transporter periplasmic adaptor subunit [Bacteroidales bacterium]|nr:efflux RND transporter periplasmic adaptor subunit [Bacteroidales bacterium]
MKTRILLISLAFSLVLLSCKTQSESENLQTELDTKKLAYSNLKLEINSLQKKIQDLDTIQSQDGIAVNVQETKSSHFEHFFRVNGSFEAIASAYVSPETSGQVKAILVKEGDYVKKGQLLAKLNTSVIENTIREVKTALSLSKIVYEKQKELWDNNIGSELDYLRAKTDMEAIENKLETLQSQLDMAIIQSPIDGVVDDIALKVGELAMPGQLMMYIINLNEFYLNAEVSEAYLPHLHKGDAITIQLLAFNKSIESNIYRISNMINPENRSFTVQVKLKNSDGILKPNMLAEIKFKDYDQQSAFTVPSIIVKDDFKGSYLFIAEQKNNQTIARKVYVESTKSQGEFSLVDTGLNEGDLVIIKGYNQVVDGSLIAIK